MDPELGQRFDRHRDQLRGVAYRMLGSLAEADDAVQETWLRLAAADTGRIDNLPAWLTTVVSRVCLDQLRTRRTRREDLTGPPPADAPAPDPTPEDEAVLVDSVGRALLVVMSRLTPDERIAFVLHDLFAVAFDDIAPVVDRTPATTKKLASRARGKVRGHPDIPATELARHRRTIERFRTAARTGDLDAVLEVLSPTVIRRADRSAIGPARPAEAHGATTVAGEIATFGRTTRFATPLLVDGTPGLAIAPHGRLRLIVRFAFDADRIAGYDLIADPTHLRRLRLAMLPETGPA
ncbi:sigma-70 family RNA polymerase sigma factor [Nocardia sp. alder85J]|uniref:sigma-70 family RNA polymerase sigma factor n=1 Tax=Nocardia sp. alder85J TaxID=2862949 RepID=UPI001CD531B5|nr:sigma-70 family RNA polymerase sigma factor [Nocardia sp. alder85J]MCX4095509.1 sigma-70 family RNA polymerase sigma factor [Nocardia sp. alder85J]